MPSAIQQSKYSDNVREESNVKEETKVNEVDDNFIQFIVFAFVLAVILLVTVLLLALPKKTLYHSPAFVGLFYLSANHIKFTYLIKD